MIFSKGSGHHQRGPPPPLHNNPSPAHSRQDIIYSLTDSAKQSLNSRIFFHSSSLTRAHIDEQLSIFHSHIPPSLKPPPSSQTTKQATQPPCPIQRVGRSINQHQPSFLPSSSTQNQPTNQPTNQPKRTNKETPLFQSQLSTVPTHVPRC